MKGPRGHIGYWVRDLEKALEPYCSLIGGEVVFRITSPATGNRIAFVCISGMMIELLEPPDKSRLEGKAGPVFYHVAFEVPDIDAVVAGLAARGVICDPPEPEPCLIGGRTTLFESPDTGGTIQIIGE